MSPTELLIVKAVCGTLVVVALAINFFERKFAPHTLLLESSPRFPSWLGWLGWGLAAIAALVYFYLDVTT
jgi:uncharacterized protein involved in cysteine biosynthesis